MGLRRLLRTIADALFPLRCIGCGRSDTALCGACISTFAPASLACPGCSRSTRHGAPCPSCRPRTSLDRLAAPWCYRDVAARAVQALKYRNARGIADRLGDALTVRCPRQLLSTTPLVVAVPMHPSRLRRRGSNHAALVADRFAVRTLLATRHDALRRVRLTTAQAKTSRRAERLENMRGAFVCTDPAAVRDRDVLLIDDVYTTGATLQDCARALKEAGARSVSGLVVARD